MIEKTKEEAARLLAKYYSQKAIVTFAKSYFGGLESIIGRPIIYTKETTIEAALLTAVEYGGLESFQILLRSIDEMSEEEKANYAAEGLGCPTVEKFAKRIDWARKNGFTTSEEDRQLITIKN